MAEVKVSEPEKINIRPTKKLRTLDSYTTKSKILEGFTWLLLIKLIYNIA